MDGKERISELDQRRSEWIRSVARGDAEAYAERVTPAIVWVAPDGHAIRGRSAFRAWVESFFVHFDYEFTVHPEQAVVRGDWAVERGHFVSALASRSSGSRSRHEGGYFLICQRCDEGQWRIDRYFDTTPG